MDPVVSNGVLAIVAALFRDDIVAMVATITRAECRVLQHLLAVVDVDGSSRDEHAQAREITTTPAVLISGTRAKHHVSSVSRLNDAGRR